MMYVNFIVGLVLVLISYSFQPANAQTAGSPLRGTVKQAKVKGLIGCRVQHTGVISRVHYNSPSQQVGLAPGDKIIAVNFEPFSMAKIYGDEGDWIYLTIMRNIPAFDSAGNHYNRQAIPMTFKIQYVRENAIDYRTNPDKFYDDMKIIEFGPVS